jgi:AraC family transcriptional regulator
VDTLAIERITAFDCSAKKDIPFVLGAEPLEKDKESPWVGIKLEHHLLGNSERPAVSTSSYLASVCLKGSSSSTYHGGLSQPEFRVPTKPGDVFLSGPGEIPRCTSNGKIEFVLVELAPKFVQLAADELATSESVEIQQRWAGKDEGIHHLMLALHHELLENCPSGPLFADYIGLSFATALLTRHATAPVRTGPYRGGLSPHKLKQVTEFINSNLSDGVSLAELANIVEMGPCHFARTFKASTGLSPHQYVLRRRIEFALRALKEAHVDLADLAYDLGFSSQGHFSTVFHKLVGVTPSDYRERVSYSKRPMPGRVGAETGRDARMLA